MDRLIRKTAILAKLETTYGADPTPSGAANALLVSNLSINPLNSQNVARDVIRKYLGASEEIVGASYVEMGFDVELVGSGTAGTAPAWGPLMRAVGFAETITALTRVDYTPISDAFESCTIYWYDDGVLHKAFGCRGTVSFDLSVGKIPKATFKFMGISGGESAVSAPATTLTAWRVPQTVIDANTGDLVFDATHSATGAPVLTTGTPYPSEGLTIDMGNTSPFQPLLGGESVPVTDRQATGSIKLKLTADQEVALMQDVRSTAKHSIGVQHGTVPGDKVLVYVASAQLTQPSKEELNGARMIGFKLRLVPVSGNDEIRIVTSF